MAQRKAVKTTQSALKNTRTRTAKKPPVPTKVTFYRVPAGQNPLDPMVEREFLFTVDWPLPDGEEHEPYLSRTCGAGRYRCELRDEQGRPVEVVPAYIGSLPMAIDEVDEETELSEINGHQTEMATIVQTVLRELRQTKAALPAQATIHEQVSLMRDLMALAQPAPPKSILEQLRELKEIEALLAPKQPEHAPRPPAETGDPEVAVMKLLLKNPDEARGLAAKLRGLFTGESEFPEGAETNGWDVVKSFGQTFLEQLAPALIHRFASLDVVAGQARLPAQEGIAAAPVQRSAPRAPGAPPAPRPAQPPMVDPQAHIQAVFALFWDGMRTNSQQTRVVAALLDVINNNPQFGPMVSALLQAETPAVMEMLSQGNPEGAAVLQLPHAEAWLEDVLNRVAGALGLDGGELSEEESEAEELEPGAAEKANAGQSERKQ